MTLIGFGAVALGVYFRARNLEHEESMRFIAMYAEDVGSFYAKHARLTRRYRRLVERHFVMTGEKYFGDEMDELPTTIDA